MRQLKVTNLRILTSVLTLVIGIASFWFSMLALTSLVEHGFVDLYSFSEETREIILDIKCVEGDDVCRGERCAH